MSKTSLKERTDRRRLGWFTALTVLCFLLSSPAWALDLDLISAKKNAESSQILSTLGHGRSVAGESRRHKNNVRVVLVKARKHKKHS